MKANAVELLAKERKELQSFLVVLQAQKQASTGDKKLRKDLVQLCKRAKKDDNPELLGEIIVLLEKMRDSVCIQDLDKTIQEHEQLILAFTQVLDHYGYVEEKIKPEKIPVHHEVISPDFGSVIPKPGGGSNRNKERMEILGSIVLRNSGEDFIPLDKVFQEFIRKVAVSAGFDYNHLGVCLNRLGYGWSTKKNQIFPLKGKTKSPKNLRNYGDKALVAFLSLGSEKQLSRNQLVSEAVRLGLVGDKHDQERLVKHLHNHCNHTLFENRIFEIVKKAQSTGPKAIGAIYSLTPIGKRLLEDHRAEFEALLGDKLKPTNTEKGE